MADLAIKIGQNFVTYYGTAALALSSLADYTALKVDKVQTIRSDGNAYLTGRPGVSVGVTTIQPPTSTQPSVFILVAKQAFTLPANLFVSTYQALDPDTLQLAATTADPLVLESIPYQVKNRPTLTMPSFSVGAGTLEVRVNGGEYGTLAAANAAIMAASDTYILQLRLTRTTTDAATATLMLIY